MRKALFAFSFVVLMLSSTAGIAQATNWEVTQWDRYSNLKKYQVTSDWGTALSWLSNHTWYKGKIWSGSTNDREVRFRQQMFDHRNSYYWCGYGYNNIYQQVLEVQNALYWLGDNPGNNRDGVWGPTTYNAVRSFQGRAGIGVDGVVGRNTWNYMVFTRRG